MTDITAPIMEFKAVLSHSGCDLMLNYSKNPNTIKVAAYATNSMYRTVRQHSWTVVVQAGLKGLTPQTS